jgi:hypothetical protein
MTREEKLDHGITGDEAAQEGIGQDEAPVNIGAGGIGRGGILPNPLGGALLAPVPGEIVDPEASAIGSDLPDEVNPEKSGLAAGADTDASPDPLGHI